MTLQVTIKNNDDSKTSAEVKMFDFVDGEAVAQHQTTRILGHGQELTATVYDGRFFTISEVARPTPVSAPA